jgi:Acetyltransferase (GNAT) domain
MDTEDLIRRADANYFHAHSVVAAAAPRGDVVQRGGILLRAMGLQLTAFNTAFVTQSLDEAEAEIKAAMSFFDDRGLPFSVRMREGVDPSAETACERLGLVLDEVEPGMMLTEIPAMPPPPAGLEIRRAWFEEGYDDFVVTMSTAMGMPLESGYDLISPELFDALWVEPYTGYVDGEPVATSTLVVSHRVAGVYNVTTLEEHRRKGYAEAMTWHAVARGVELRAGMSSLQATPMGVPLYEHMGYRTVCVYKDYVRPG